MNSNDLKITAKDPNENDKPVSEKLKTKKSLRGGDPNHVNPSNGSVLCEQALFSINGCFYRKYKKSFEGSKRNITNH